jgi:ABC-type Zn uptake system ZnuABC Zn-binding protein ZnuA
VGALAFSGCSPAEDPWKDIPGGSTRIVTSFAPLYCFAKTVAGPDAKVQSLLTTTGPHEFKASGQEFILLKKADLFLANGLGLDDKIIEIVGKSGNARLKIVKVGEAVPEDTRLMMGEHEEAHEKDQGKGAHEHHHHEGHDPHVWLGIPEAIRMVERIRDVLKKEDPAHSDGYTKRAADFVQELRQVHKEGKRDLAGKKNRKIIAQHESLAYFARAFGLEVEGAIQPQPGIEADAVKLTELVNLCTKEKIRVIAVEPQYSRGLAETLAKQLRARNVAVRIVEVDNLETADLPLEPGLYLRKMRENIEVLANNLE